MAQGKPKQFARPQKKPKPKTSEPQTPDDYQELADFEEEAGGKWRAGDPAKSTRAFLRALEVYDKGLAKHPRNFDLAYNKARLQFEITQNPALVAQVGQGLDGLLRECLESHRLALKLDSDNVDVLFNTSQVLTSLAELLGQEDSDDGEATGMLQEGLELLSLCLARQEMLLEQQKAEFDTREEVEDGGVAIGSESGSATGSAAGEESATIINPVTPGDLLDTVQASLTALTTLVPLVDASDIGAFGDMAQSLTETKAPSYIALLPDDAQDNARFTIGLARAIFIANFADAQFSAHTIEMKTYIERLQAFQVPGKEQNAHALTSEAQARSELVLSALDQTEAAGQIDGSACWSQLSIGQDGLTKASKLSTEDAKEGKAKIFELKADVELLRYRLATTASVGLSDAVRKSAPTLLANAATYYRGACNHGRALGDEEAVERNGSRYALVNYMVRQLNRAAGSSSSAAATASGEPAESFDEEWTEVLEECVEEGLITIETANELVAQKMS